MKPLWIIDIILTVDEIFWSSQILKHKNINFLTWRLNEAKIYKAPLNAVKVVKFI
jgi:hypothetical protein